MTGDAKNGSSVTLDLQRCHKDPQGATRSHKESHVVKTKHMAITAATRTWLPDLGPTVSAFQISQLSLLVPIKRESLQNVVGKAA